ncbi:Acyl-CoA dehydrogenase type 2 domain-containing protein [Fictibacillus macauensis ZFHKF-1]|uniref:Acyl-CoA dehydrogenase type 2 domain-containing protein n=1 Tax=Fictibacillus macauensis ZFHKF-1 TaxID=1196324 RepID=I8J5M8_9BACL|nr:acyl-CoA dehydrogenase family protein [Fictibacillus macauensis]EIT87106.1 Acyl-CoA dehydrogenase type 2 domain-containing protein [Fictibacillus macauensis ZFHKF-1]
MEFITTQWQEKWLKRLAQLGEQFAKRAPKHDQEGTFPFDNFKDLREEGYLALTVPKAYGGQEITLHDFILLQEELGRYDGSTALSVGWHLGVLMDLRESKEWREETYEKLCRAVVTKGSLVNRVSSERATGSPTRGGKPETTAERKDGNWVISGVKAFASMAPALDYFIITATIQETGEVGTFVIPKDVAGLSIEERWDTLGMRGTRSDDLHLDHVVVREDAFVGEVTKPKHPVPKGWLLHIPACYLGIARAARDEAVAFAKSYAPNSIEGTIASLPAVRDKIGLMDLELLKARQFMYGVIERWEQAPDRRHELTEALAAVKYIATNSAQKIVDLAMRVEGAHGLFQTSPLQRYYRDVRAGLHNPPMDDAVIALFAKKALDEDE